MPRASAYATATNAAAAAAISSTGSGARLRGVSATYSYSGAVTAGKLTISSNSVTLMEVDIVATAATMARVQLDSISSALGQDLTATLGAGGTGVVGKVTLVATSGKDA